MSHPQVYKYNRINLFMGAYSIIENLIIMDSTFLYILVLI